MYPDEIPVGKCQDLRGQKFGKWTVLYRTIPPNPNSHDNYWLCQCECGNKKRIRRDHLINEHSYCEQCSPKYENLLGQRFGRLIVVEDTNIKNSSGQEIWKCKCDCGNFTNVPSHRLKSGVTTSCGCFQKEQASIANKILVPEGTKYGLLTVIKEINRDPNKPSQRRFLCKCDCGNTITTTFYALRYGQRKSCGCATSIGESTIIKLLNQYNIKYCIEKTFNDFKYSDTGGVPRFDFYINDQYLIEYDGNIHFGKNIHENTWNTQDEYEKRHKHDLEKNEWCKNNNIPLIRIPYTQLNKLSINDLLLETTSFRVA